MKRKLKLSLSLMLVLSSLCLGACSNKSISNNFVYNTKAYMAPKTVTSQDTASIIDFDPTISVFSEEPSFTSRDGTVRYYLPDEFPASLDGYPVVTVSPHEFTVEEAQDLANSLFGNATHYDYIYNRPLTVDEMNANISRWETYLEDGTVSELVHGNESMVNDFREVLNRFKSNYSSYIEVVMSPYEQPQSDWTFHPDSYYYGEQFAEKGAFSIRTIVTANDVKYQFNVFKRDDSEFSVNMVYANLYYELSPNNIDPLIQQYMLCKSPAPTEAQLDSIKKQVSNILHSLDVGNWVIDSCEAERLPRGTEEAYLVTVKASPVFADASVISHPQLSSLRGDKEYSQHYYYTDATFTFAPDSTLLSFSVQSPLDITTIGEDAEIIDTDKLMRTAEEILSDYSVSDYAAYYIPEFDKDLTAKVYIDRVQNGLSRLEIRNGEEYRYVPSLCFDAHIEFCHGNEAVFDSTRDGERRILVLNATDGSRIMVGEAEFVRLDD